MHEYQQIEIASALGSSKLTLRRSGDDVIGVRVSTPDYNVSTVIKIPEFLLAARTLCEPESMWGKTAPMERVFHQIAEERARQNTLVDAGKIPWNCANSIVSLADKHAVFTEEVLEAAREFTAHACANLAVERHEIRRKLRAELIQVAAVTVAILESLEGQP